MADLLKSEHLVLPLFVAADDPVLTENADAYEATAMGNYRLTDSARAHIKQANADHDAKVAAWNAEIIAKDSEIESIRRQLAEHKIAKAIDTALAESCWPAFRRCVGAVIAKEIKFEVHDRTVVAEGYGSVTDAVASYMASAEAEPFRTPEWAAGFRSGVAA